MFGRIVVEHRRRLNLTQEELAVETGLSARTIRALEAGPRRLPRPSTVRLLADVFGLDGERREAFTRAADGSVRVAAGTVGPVGPASCLPRPPTHFTGREAELTRLVDAVDRQPDGRPLVVAVDGMPGVGKTALSLEAAYRLAGRFTGGQLFVDLRGHSEHAPVDPAVALGLLLDQLGVPAERIPETTAGRSARWRTESAARRILVVLDNAASSAQVQPLLPGMSSALVLVTGRRRLIGLHPDVHLALNPLDDAAAAALLVGVIGERRAPGRADAVHEVAHLCGNLPLALRLTAAHLLHRPMWTVDDLAGRLRESGPPVVELSAEGTTVAAALTLSYRQLSEPAARLLRRISLHGGEDVDVHALAALDDTTPACTRRAVDELLDVHLLQERDRGRYRLHDLIHDYAAHLAAETDDEPTRRAAVRRLLDYYVQTLVADMPDGSFGNGPHVPDVGPPSRHRRVFSTGAERLRWETAEWRNVLAAAETAESAGMDRHVCLLARAAWEFHFRRANVDILVWLNRAALAAANRLGDAGLIAMAHHYLAGAYVRGGRLEQGRPHLARAVAGWHASGDPTAGLFATLNLVAIDLMSGRFDAAIRQGRHTVEQLDGLDPECATLRRRVAVNRVDMLRMIGECHLMQGRHRVALGYLRRAARQCVDLGGQQGYQWVNVLTSLGRAHTRLGHRVTAPLLLRRALAIAEESGNGTLSAEILGELGTAHLLAGEPGEARRLHEKAAGHAERTGSPLVYCQVLNRLGATLLRVGDARAAEARHRHALAIALRIESRYEEAVAHAGLAAVLSAADPEAADRHAREGDRLFASIGAAADRLPGQVAPRRLQLGP